MAGTENACSAYAPSLVEERESAIANTLTTMREVDEIYRDMDQLDREQREMLDPACAKTMQTLSYDGRALAALLGNLTEEVGRQVLFSDEVSNYRHSPMCCVSDI
jgi:hypothetical protein